jgi:hypothetical protein
VEDPRTLGVLHRIPTGWFVAVLMAVLAGLLLVAMRFDPMVDRPVSDDSSHTGPGAESASAVRSGVPGAVADHDGYGRPAVPNSSGVHGTHQPENADARATPPQSARASRPNGA